MTTTELGACEWFVWDLRRSNLIDRAQLDQVIADFLTKNPTAEPPALAEHLVGQGILTEFQAERLLQGKTQGFVLGPFMLNDALGTGSMGTVYKALSKTDQKLYAVKVLPRRSMWNVRIARRKVRAFEQCKHPAVVPFVDVGTAGGMHYLAWPMVEGTSLDKVVAEQGRLAPEIVAKVALQTAEGLEQTHAQGLFHGLLKPSNLMLTPDDHVRILDYGIGCLLAETEGESLVDTMSTANSVNSGLDCSSPESIMDPTHLDAIGDQYSLGCVMYFCLAGQYPFPDGTAVEKMMSHQTKKPKPLASLNPDVPAGLVAVVEKLMQKQPAQRYANCSEVIEALKPFATESAAPQQRRPMAMPRAGALKKEPAPLAPPVTERTPPAPASGRSPHLPPRPAAKSPAVPADPHKSAGPPRVGQGSLPPRSPSAIAASKLPRPGQMPRPTPPLPAARPAAEHHPQQRPAHQSPVAAPEPAEAQEAPAAPPQAPHDYRPAPTLGQRLGNAGIIVLSIFFGVLAYFVSSMIKF